MDTMALANMLCGNGQPGSMGCHDCARSMGSVSGEIDPYKPILDAGGAVVGVPPGTTSLAATLLDAGGGLFKSKTCGKCRYKAANKKCGRIHTPKCDAFWKASKAGASKPLSQLGIVYPYPQHAALYPVGDPNNPYPGYGNSYDGAVPPPQTDGPMNGGGGGGGATGPVYQTPGGQAKQAGMGGGMGWAIAAAAALALVMFMKK